MVGSSESQWGWDFNILFAAFQVASKINDGVELRRQAIEDQQVQRPSGW